LTNLDTEKEATAMFPDNPLVTSETDQEDSDAARQPLSADALLEDLLFNGLTSAQAESAIIAAKRRLKRAKTISVEDIEIEDDTNPECDVLPAEGGVEEGGVWVHAWIHVSPARMKDAQKGSPSASGGGREGRGEERPVLRLVSPVNQGAGGSGEGSE
jgi:hypothetical protein